MLFADLPVDPRCLRLLEAQQITAPTPVQAAAIPVAAEGRDLIAIAQTGTGKTLAFGLPALTRLAKAPQGRTAMLVLAPTRELAVQVHAVLAPLAKAFKLTSCCIYGGVGMNPQADALRRGVQIVVATPGGLLDHLGRGYADFSAVSILVLDEADRMLDMGFLPDIRRILKMLPAERQTMMFSATFPNEIARLAETMQRDPARIEVGAARKPVDAVRQALYAVNPEHKLGLLEQILRRDEVDTTVVFLRTKRAADRVARFLARKEFSAEAIHGDHSQGRRQSVLDGFRRGRHKILVATDVAARGLDVKGITHVINYDLPATSDDYVHRIGRTARASAEGDAITFVSPGQEKELRIIEHALGKPIERVEWEGQATLASAPAVRDRNGFVPAGSAFQRRAPRRGRPSRARTTW